MRSGREKAWKWAALLLAAGAAAAGGLGLGDAGGADHRPV